MNRATLILLIVLILIAAAIIFFWKPAATTPYVPPTSTTTGSSGVTAPPEAGSATSADITISTPQSGALVTSPLLITGQARGTWYFEAQFPIKLYDADGNIIATTPGQAQGDWETTSFVPFSATLTFSQPTTATGTLVLMNDNPSDNPDTAQVVRIPVTFAAEP